MARVTGRLRSVLICCAVAVIALVSGGIFTFPILSPALALHLKLTQTQLTTVVLAGIIGQYPFAVVVGKIIDSYGPWVCSLASAGLFSTGFSLFAWEISKTPDDITAPSQSSFRRLTCFFFMCGLGTVFGLFSSLFAASKNFPQHLGMASGASMAMFSLSPLFLSVAASTFFTDPQTGLNVTHFVVFLATLSGVVNVFAAALLYITRESSQPSATVTLVPEATSSSSSIGSDSIYATPASAIESDPLLPKGPQVDVEIIELPIVEPDGTVFDLLKDPQFWILSFLTFVGIGTCEMVIANVGSIVLSFPPSAPMGSHFLDRRTDIATSTQVQVISVANTLSRLLAGPLADYISPIASYLPTGERSYPRKHYISRMAFITASMLLSATAFVILELFIRSQDSIWLLSVCVGTAYGVIFTILPSILSAIWGANNLGRNFGMMTYAAFAGTPFFSYLYAYIAEHHSEDGVCKGAQCWRLTFWVATGAVISGSLASGVLWRRWRGLC